MIKFARKVMTRWYVAVLMSSCVLFYSCQSAETKPTRSFTGEALFTGIFFGQGDVLNYVPELQERHDLKRFLTTEEEFNRYAEVQANIIGFLQQSSPSFFTDFKKEIESGDHVRIASAIKGASQGIVVAVNKHYGLDQQTVDLLSKEIDEKTGVKEFILGGGNIDENKIDPQLNSLLVGYLDTQEESGGDPSGRQTCVVGPIAIAVAAVLVAVITIAWAVVDVYPTTDSQGSTLLNEQIVHSIATKLATQ